MRRLASKALAAAGLAVSATLLVVPQASADDLHRNVYITTYDDYWECHAQRDALNKDGGFPDALDQYYYCGVTNRDLWFRQYTGDPIHP
jgi:hypothetical protein